MNKVYIGELNDKFRAHGCGKQSALSHGGSYEGEWYDGELHGFGVLVHGSGDKYEGMFEKGERRGQGTITHANGTVLEGKWITKRDFVFEKNGVNRIRKYQHDSLELKKDEVLTNQIEKILSSD
ncbi:hypothetical protein FGO68_gene6815 [Halteria grandinella]|uniref:MORN repeat protein n=1 Tax=Halteria grandinella TaxID=5974 RepID=A0A8J8NJ83_HALGN|nr:hypothetical protein FGO68_gene6815 [Halteria grandinella]